MPKLTFAENEKALCFHGPLMYEAKVSKAELWDKDTNVTGQVGPHYFVHYKGWKQSWDEWVPEERLKKFNEENKQKQKALIDAQRARDAAERIAAAAAEEIARKMAGGVGGAPGGAMPVGTVRRDDKRGMKRGRDGVEGEEEYQKRPEIKISIPDVLKTQLVDDWEAVTKNMQLVKLPRDPNVDTILQEWINYHANDPIDRRRLAAEVTSGLRIYFNKALGNNLLYRFERGQYSEQMKTLNIEEGRELSSIYGAEHLLRLFVNLPELLAHTAMDPETAAVLKENVGGFLEWMKLNKDILFANDYENTASGYQNNNRG